MARSEVADRGSALDQLRVSQDRYHDLFNHSPDMLAIVEVATRRIIECNATLVPVTGFEREEILGREIEEMYPPELRVEARTSFERFKGVGEVSGAERLLRRRDQPPLEVSLAASSVRDGSGSIVSSRTAWRDITSMKDAERALRAALAKIGELTENLRQLAGTDELTELPNRRSGLDTVRRERARAKRAGSACSLAMIDIDRFKQVNDTHGHEVGDSLLKAIRWGGEEFLAVLSETDRAGAIAAVERVRLTLESLVLPPIDGITVSAGVAESIGSEQDGELIVRADEALYVTKNSGRNRVIGAD